MEKKSISEFLDNDYKEYSLYVVENRAIPSLVDGFKPTQRKIAETMRRVWGSSLEGKPMKVIALVGEVMSKLAYNNGDSAASAAIIGMTQTFKNSLPIFSKVGQFGTMRSPEAGAPRYISVKPSQWFHKIYKDFDLCEFQEEDGVNVEPKYFLPVLPMILLNGTSGVAIGYSTDILNRHPLDICNAVENVLKEKPVNSIDPWWSEFSGEIIKKEGIKSSYLFRGKIEKIDSNKVLISELPPSMTFEKFEKLLNTLLEKKLIVDWDDESKGSPKYKVKFRKDDLASKEIEDLIKMFKLEESQTENITCLDHEKNLKFYDNPETLIRDFVNFRLPFYEKRKEKTLETLKKKIAICQDKIVFLNAVIENKISLNVSKKDLVDALKKISIQYIDECIAMSFSSCTIEEKTKLEKLVEDSQKEEKNLLKKTAKNLYLEDLSILKKDLEKIFE